MQRSACSMPSVIDLVRYEGENVFELTDMGSLLYRSHGHLARNAAIHAGQPYLWAAWSHLLYSILTGEPAFPRVHGMGVWDYRTRHASAGRIFAEAMGSSEEVAPATDDSVLATVIDAYDFGQANVVVDIGGGHGALLASILTRYPSIAGILLETPDVTDRARAVLDGAGVGHRCTFVDGNFLQRVPPGGTSTS